MDKFAIRDRRPRGVALWGVVEVAGSFPVLDQLVAVEAPVGVPLNWKTSECAANPQVTTTGGLVRTEFRRTKVPGVNMAELGADKSGLCRLVFSTARDWAEVRGFLEKNVEAAAAPEAGVREKAQDVVKDSVLDGERIARIHDFVVDGDAYITRVTTVCLDHLLVCSTFDHEFSSPIPFPIERL